MSQYIPVEATNQARIRTGYERVMAHRAGMPFAYVASNDGVVVSIDEKISMMLIEYKNKDRVAIEYGHIYSRHSSENFYIDQKIAINGCSVGGRFKKGDVLVYNTSYFSVDPFSKQVDMGLGYFTNVAMIDSDKTLYDSSVVSPALNEALTIKPSMMRPITLDKTTILHQVALVGTEVTSVDPLMVFDEADISDKFSDDETRAIIMALNKSIPKAKYTGKIVNIEIFHRCPFSEMSPSLAKFVKAVTKAKNDKAKFGAQASNGRNYKPAGPITSDKIDGFVLDNDTVYIRYYIQQDLSMNSADKVVFGAQLKSVSTGVMAEAPTTESGRVVDAIMEASSVYNRIVPSVIYQGVLESIMERLEQNVVKAYFD